MTENNVEQKTGETVYSEDGIWFPYSSLEDYQREHPEKGYVFTADIQAFKNDSLTDKQKDVFRIIEKSQGREASYIVGGVKLVSIEEPCSFCQTDDIHIGKLFNLFLDGKKIVLSTKEGPSTAKSEIFTINYCPHCGKKLPLSK